jgi:hypothetical protein
MKERKLLSVASTKVLTWRWIGPERRRRGWRYWLRQARIISSARAIFCIDWVSLMLDSGKKRNCDEVDY